jgi:hypothetical protein
MAMASATVPFQDLTNPTHAPRSPAPQLPTMNTDVQIQTAMASQTMQTRVLGIQKSLKVLEALQIAASPPTLRSKIQMMAIPTLS